ncbi:dual specificity protein phosphatase family protein [candidate division KSB1 bacterium]|nr:dual specificity protein phosphatase family protein [candidate division KSB1 bacterium]
MELFPIDDAQHLFISPEIDDWQPITERQISVIIDLDGDIDIGVPTVPNQLLYIYFPIRDGDLPDLHKLHALGQFGATLLQQGQKILSHCGLGCNRSALVAGVILNYLGMDGASAVRLLREKRPGALFNEQFAAYLNSLDQNPVFKNQK